MTKDELLKSRDLLLRKKPFLRGSSTFSVNDPIDGLEASPTQVFTAQIPSISKVVVSQERFAKELDPNSHDVIFDENLPKICVKLNDGSFKELQFVRMGIPFQERIRQKQTLCLSGNNTEFTLRGATPSNKDKDNFYLFKEYWQDRNMDGLRTKAIYTQKGYGDSGLLFYYNSKHEIKCRLISYEDGYVIISHNDDNGERVLECIYYRDENNREVIDCYDEKYRYRYHEKDGEEVVDVVEHGFEEIPLVTKRGNVAWNDAQPLISMFETMYNLFLVIQKRFGFGILYVKGRFKSQAEQIAGNIILNDASVDGNGDAKILKNDAGQNMIEYLANLFEHIQIASSTTFLLPKDIKSSGDISAIAIMLTQSLDLECANNGVIDWQNFIDKMARLFKYGLAKELVHKGINKNAVTEFAKLRISAKLKVWRPFNEAEYNQMLCTMKGAGIISTKTAVERNTVSKPDEESRLANELEASKADAAQQQEDNQQEVEPIEE